MLNEKNSSCQFAEQMVSYLYGESETKEKIKIEAHLRECSDCLNEFEGFQSARSSILEWRDVEFSALAMPTFENLPIEQKSFAAVEPNKTDSWFAGFRKLFSFNPAFALASLIAVATIGIAFYALSFNRANETAGLQNSKSIEKPTVSPTVAIAIPSPETAANEKPTGKNLPKLVEAVDSSNEKKREASIAPTRTVVKVPANSSKNNSDNMPVAVKEPLEKKPSPVKKRLAPSLNEIEDDEDKTVRLADLFAELDTK